LKRAYGGLRYWPNGIAARQWLAELQLPAMMLASSAVAGSWSSFPDSARTEAASAF